MSPRTLYEAFQHQVQSRPDATALLLDAAANVSCPCSWHELSIVVNRVAERIENQLNRDPNLARRVTHLSDNRDVDIVVALASLRLLRPAASFVLVSRPSIVRFGQNQSCLMQNTCA